MLIYENMATPSTNDAASCLSDNLRQLRASRGLTQAKVAASAGLPRPTYASLETGEANPTLSVLVRVAAALQVQLEELLSPPRASVRFFPKGSLPMTQRGDATVTSLLPDPLPGLQLERLELSPGGRMKGSPHVAGTREYLICERGVIELAVSGERFVLEEGCALVFRGDQAHSYKNPGRVRAVAMSAVLLASA